MRGRHVCKDYLCGGFMLFMVFDAKTSCHFDGVSFLNKHFVFPIMRILLSSPPGMPLDPLIMNL